MFQKKSPKKLCTHVNKKKLDRVANIYISQLKKNFILLFFYWKKLSAVLQVFSFKNLKNLIEFILNYPNQLLSVTSTTLVFLSCKKDSFRKKSYVPPGPCKIFSGLKQYRVITRLHSTSRRDNRHDSTTVCFQFCLHHAPVINYFTL